MASVSDFATSRLVEWWEKNRKESEKELDRFVDEYPDYWAVAAFLKTTMDVGAMTVDVLRFGEGAAESYETGKVAPLIQDVFRGLAIAGGAANVAQAGRPLLGKVIGLYADPGGMICAPLALGNALRRTGQRFLLSLEEIAQAHGFPGIASITTGTTMQQTIAALRAIGVKFRELGRARSFEALVEAAREGKGAVMFRVMRADGQKGHRIFLEKAGDAVRIVDRTGIYTSLKELSQRYGIKFIVDPNAPALFIEQVMPRLLKGIPTLMIFANGLFARLNGGMTVPELDEKFKEFKKPGGKPAVIHLEPFQRVAVKTGDTLSGLAAKFYGSFEYWPLIWDVNRATVGPNPNRINPGLMLKIHPLTTFSAIERRDARHRHTTWRRH